MIAPNTDNADQELLQEFQGRTDAVEAYRTVMGMSLKQQIQYLTIAVLKSAIAGQHLLDLIKIVESSIIPCGDPETARVPSDQEMQDTRQRILCPEGIQLVQFVDQLPPRHFKEWIITSLSHYLKNVKEEDL